MKQTKYGTKTHTQEAWTLVSQFFLKEAINVLMRMSGFQPIF